MVFSTLLNKTQCVSAICAASVDADKSIEADGAVCVIINVFTLASNAYSSAPRTMLNVRISPAVLIISSLLECEILFPVSIEYCKNSNFDKALHTYAISVDGKPMGLVHVFKF